MNIGSTIKKLRREKDMTQEDLAEALGVSVSAVSQWELEKTAPDLSLIPPLCNLLGVSADTLLGIDLEAKEKRIDEITKKANAFDFRGYTEEAYEILTEGLKEFPDSFQIMRFLIHNLHSRSKDSTLSKEEQKHAAEEAIRLSERILEKCTDDDIRHSAIQMLCFLYPELGQTERAVEIAHKMPTMVISRDFLLPHIHKKEEGYRCDKLLLADLIQFLSSSIVFYGRQHENGEMYYNDEDRAALREKRIAFLHLMYEEGDFGFYHCHLKDTHALQALYFAQKHDAENTLYHLAKASEHAIGFVKYASTDKYVHTSLLFREYDKSNSCFSTDSQKNSALQVLNHMNKAEYDFVRDTPEFAKIQAELKKYAKNWDPASFEQTDK